MRRPRWRWAYYVLMGMYLPMLFGGFFLGMWWSVGWGIFVMGVGTLGFVVSTVILNVQFQKRAYHADGIVIAYQKGPESWNPIVRYTLPDGQEITFLSHTYYIGIRKSLPVSAQVGVLYDPDHPESAIINRPTEKFGFYAGVLFVVALMVFLSFTIVEHGPH